ncbi:unnamed protein product [Paramecium sonneborni]|uniref:Calpain catalytic domain-containing protein n=1 Tax=Paramecium sonneborni TaxID=65129 RepID=A0A8S1NT50_9CILI|nr:unnamed protein product [Paramecium sonneborni]
MYNKLQEIYIQGLQTIQQFSPNPDDITECQLDNQSNQIKFFSIEDLDITNSLLPCKSLYISQYYKNCALINAFNVLQSKIQFVKDIYEKTDNPYAVWLCDQGEWKIIIVNDKVPCITDINNSIHSVLQCDYQWPIIIEKAVAKLLGASYNSFNHLISHSIESFVYILFGSPITKIRINNIEDLKNLLDDKTSILYVELFQNSINNAYVIKSIQDQNEKVFVELQALNQQAIHNEGIMLKESNFLLSWNIIQIQTISQVHLNNNYQTFTFTMQKPIERKIPFEEHTYIYTFQIDEQINEDKSYWISICQRDFNFSASKQLTQIKYGLIRLLIFRNKKKGYELISESIDFTQNLYLKIELIKGQYTLLCQAEFYNLAYLSEEIKNLQQRLKLQIQAIKPPNIFDQNNQNEEKLKQLIISMIRQKSTNLNTLYEKDQGFPNVQKTSDKTKGFFYIYYENHGDTIFEDNIEFIHYENLIKYDTLKMDTKVKISIHPKDYLLILYKFDPRILLIQNDISFQYEINYNNKQSLLVQKKSLFEYMLSLKDPKYNQIKNPKISIKQHPRGVVLLFSNIALFPIVVECQLQLQNLKIYLNNLTLEGQKIKFQLNKKAHLFVFLNIEDPAIKTFNYKMNFTVQNKK